MQKGVKGIVKKRLHICRRIAILEACKIHGMIENRRNLNGTKGKIDTADRCGYGGGNNSVKGVIGRRCIEGL